MWWNWKIQGPRKWEFSTYNNFLLWFQPTLAKRKKFARKLNNFLETIIEVLFYEIIKRLSPSFTGFRRVQLVASWPKQAGMDRLVFCCNLRTKPICHINTSIQIKETSKSSSFYTNRTRNADHVTQSGQHIRQQYLSYRRSLLLHCFWLLLTRFGYHTYLWPTAVILRSSLSFYEWLLQPYSEEFLRT